MTEELQQKQVQEIAKSCTNEVPEKFIHKNGYPQAKFELVPMMDDTVIDLSLLFDDSNSSSSEALLEFGKLQSALSQWGCFQAMNHGMSSTFLDEVREATKQFFNLPLEEKQKYSRGIKDYDGYGNDTVVSENQILDWTDRLFLTVYPEDQQKLQYWPEKPLAFRKVINEYIMKLRTMFEPLLKAMARCLSLDENSFVNEHGESVIMAARFNFYPQCPDPKSVLGIKPHADGTAVTMLLQDKQVEGLQVQKDDQWFRVPIVPDALFINVGDLLEIMSNGILKSPVHRVVTNSDYERISLAVFCFPDPNKEVGPVADLITDEQPQMYQRVRHYENIFFKYYQLGQRPLHAVRI
ncbi:hypothetical protein RND81_08G071800 [Saponaria officinalis]|uniref:Fe2OG dioxygenase domain-containing protein n=1 Tax=Saponaria officinalis TaxID=3572 RepID=A0AAW1J6S3_SAPOF